MKKNLEKKKVDPYKKITEEILAELESGVVPWSQPWQEGSYLGEPENADGKPYSHAGNRFLLSLLTIKRGYQSPRWMTFDRARKLGGKVKKGEKEAYVLTTWKVALKEGEKENKKAEETETEEKSQWRRKTTPVFNADQIDGLPKEFYIQPQALTPFERIEAAEKFFNALGADIKHVGDSAFYSPKEDTITMPAPALFASQSGYYSTLAHEFTHWTKHPSRLDRSFGASKMGNEAYAKEEMVAEMGAAYLCMALGVPTRPREDHAGYIQHYAKMIRTNPRFFFIAATKAEAAVEYIEDKAEKNLLLDPSFKSTPVSELRPPEPFKETLGQEGLSKTKTGVVIEYQGEKVFKKFVLASVDGNQIFAKTMESGTMKNPTSLLDYHNEDSLWNSTFAQAQSTNLSLDGLDAQELPLDSLYLKDQTIRGADFSAACLSNAHFEDVIFESCAFNKTDFANVHFLNCTFKGGYSTGANLTNAKLYNTFLEEGFNFDDCFESGVVVKEVVRQNSLEKKPAKLSPNHI